MHRNWNIAAVCFACRRSRGMQSRPTVHPTTMIRADPAGSIQFASSVVHVKLRVSEERINAG